MNIKREDSIAGDPSISTSTLIHSPNKTPQTISLQQEKMNLH